MDQLFDELFIISIHAPLTGSDLDVVAGVIIAGISIHAPLTGSDDLFHPLAIPNLISIHAPLTGSDTLNNLERNFYFDFNPRSPHRERRTVTVNQ